MTSPWGRLKDAAIRAGVDDALRPIAHKLMGRTPDTDDLASFELIARLSPAAVCVDVGCHKGKFLNEMRRAAPRGRFFAFEPIPYLFDLLAAKYERDKRVELHNCALSRVPGRAKFFVNLRDMGLSGLNKREARMGADALTEVEVEIRTLDEVVGEAPVSFLKIDVEGAELDVLAGGRRMIERTRPVVLFEFGLGGAEYFGVGADEMHAFFSGLGYRLHRVADAVDGRPALDREAFQQCFESNSAYNFVAFPG